MAGSNINRVVLTGNLTFDPELRSTASGMSVCRLRLAVNGRRKDPNSQQWVDKPNYFDVTVWGAQGENCARFLSKGRPVAIDGRLEWREWADKDTGAKRSAVDIIADTVQFLGSGGGEGGGGGQGGGFASQGGGSFQGGSDIPADTSDFGPAQPAPVGGGSSPTPTGDDDIPF